MVAIGNAVAYCTRFRRCRIDTVGERILRNLLGIRLAVAGLLFSATGCAVQATRPDPGTAAASPGEAFPAAYRPLSFPPVLIRDVMLLDGRGGQFEAVDVLFDGGRIVGIGSGLHAVPGARVIDGRGKWLTPGLIDVHSHIGVYPSPSHEANQDGNEITSPNTAQVWAEHSIWPQDPQFSLALAGGVTAMQILPGSANLFGGRGVTVRSLPARTVQEMKFPGAPHSLKMACGENPKRVYGTMKQQAPGSAMANVAGYRAAWIKAAAYLRKWEQYERKKEKDPDAEQPDRDLQLETLAEVLRGNILVHNHCYRAEEMAIMLDIAREFGYRIAAFHHAVEAYKVADLLAANDVCAAMWPEWWGFKQEAFDMVEENAALVDRAGACAIIHSDSAVTAQFLNQEAAKVMAAAGKAGMPVSRAHAVTWITYNAAKALGIAGRTGSIEPGKLADAVLWDGDPFSVYTRAEKVFIDGALVYDRLDRGRQPVTDFELGILDPLGERL
jgi:imidazolonepropionase-like amidohydrolase